MPLPASLTVINLRGTFLKPNGSPEVGTVLIYSDEHLSSSSDNTIVAPTNKELTLDVDGYFSIDLPATNDPQWGPLNYTYTVKEKLSTGTRTYKIAVPYDSAGGVLDLADVSPVQNNPDPATYVLVSTANQNGGYPRIDSLTGKIPVSVIPAGGGNADGSFKGTWSGATAYISGDTVIRSGNTYGAIQNSTNQDPVSAPLFWTQYASSAAAVTSVNGQTGVVVLAAADVGADAAGAASTAVAAHVAAVDPHGDRAFTTSSITTHSGAADPHGDRAFATAAISTHAGATDPHGDRAYADGIVSPKANSASPTFTGTVTLSGRSVSTPDVLADAATIAVDASLGNDFTVTLGGNRTLGNPTNSTNGQKLLFAIRQDATGSRTLALGSDYRFGTDITSITLSTAAGKTDYLGVRYNATDSKWDVLMFLKGF
jgi:hypothetical protein